MRLYCLLLLTYYDDLLFWFWLTGYLSIQSILDNFAIPINFRVNASCALKGVYNTKQLFDVLWFILCLSQFLTFAQKSCRRKGFNMALCLRVLCAGVAAKNCYNTVLTCQVEFGQEGFKGKVIIELKL